MIFGKDNPLSIYMRLRPKRHEETFDKGHTGIRER
jgi:hypothetical protein